MLKLLKIVDKVEKPVMLNEAVSLNISANGDSPDDITAILGKLVNLSNPSAPTSTQDMTPHGGHKDMMMKTIADVDGYADGAAHEYADEMGEEYANEPDPEVSDVEYMTKDLAGGLNKPKAQFKKEYPGDNPMTMEEARAAELMAEYKALKEARTDELSRKTLGSYAYKADNQLGKVDATGPSHKAGIPSHYRGKNKELGKDPADKMRARKAGVKLAVNKLNKTEQIEDEGIGSAAWALTKGAVKVPAKAVGNLAGGAAKGALRGAGSLGKGLVKGVAKAAPAVVKGVGGAVGNVAMGAARGIGRAGSGMAKDIKQVGRDVKTAYRKEATDPRDSRPETHRTNNTGYAWDKLSTRSPSSPKDSKATKSGKQLGLKHSIKGALGSHGPKGHLPEATDKKPTDDAKKKKKSEKMKAYRADRDKHGED